MLEVLVLEIKLLRLIKMKVLSIKQPFAELIVTGKKTIELRSWNTKFRGEFLVHASKVPDKKAMARFGFEKLPLGAIVGSVKLVEVKEYMSENAFNDDCKKHRGVNYEKGYGFILERAKRIKEIPVLGKLGFWDF